MSASLMHTYHLYFSYLLKNVEKNQLSDSVLQLSRRMLDNSISQYEQLKGTEWEEAAKRNVAFFTVGTKLLDDSIPINDYVGETVSYELNNIAQAAGIQESAVTGEYEDYTQYIPRGYYEGDPGLERYFRAMMWYGRIHFVQENEELDRSALLISKALMEKVAIAQGRALGKDAKTTICCTRYGNVMASRGSVIPLWVEQMMDGKPITITDPEMTRFMMTLDDAVDLVVYAFTHGENGDLFVQKAPAATLSTLAMALKEIYTKVNPKYGETEVKVIGTRHGEKLYETLVTREEMAKSIDMGNYYRIPCDNRDLNYDKFFTEGNEVVSTIEDYHSHNTVRLDVEGMKEQLMRLRFIQEDLGVVSGSKGREIRSE